MKRFPLFHSMLLLLSASALNAGAQYVNYTFDQNCTLTSTSSSYELVAGSDEYVTIGVVLNRDTEANDLLPNGSRAGNDMTNIEFTLDFPQDANGSGLRPTSDADDYWLYELDGVRDPRGTARCVFTHTFDDPASYPSHKLIGTNTSKYRITANPCSLVEFYVKADANMVPGTYELRYHNLKYTAYSDEKIQNLDGGVLCTIRVKHPDEDIIIPDDSNDRLRLSDISLNANETRTVDILLDNAVAYTALQTDLYLPDGVEVATDTEGNPIFNLTYRMAGRYTLNTRLQDDGSTRLWLMPQDIGTDTIVDHSGAILTFSVRAAADFAGIHQMWLRHTICSDRLASAGSHLLPNAKSWVNVYGDVTGDGMVDITDLNAANNTLLGRQDNAIYANRSDINGDGIVDVADINLIINIILGFSQLDIPDEGIAFTANGVRFTMIPVEGGTFTMGATAEQGDDAESDEKPAHEVMLGDFAIGQTEVTQELWVAVMGSNPSWFNGYGNSDYGSYHSNVDYGTNLQRPVEMVTWEDCQAFIAKLNSLTGRTFRLPTEAEWEYAARGGQLSEGHKYAGSDDIGKVAWYTSNAYSVGSSNSNYGTHSVATKAPNELSLYDMTGNVWEWCADWYGDYSSSPQTNPTGPASGSKRVCRGGSWNSNAVRCRVSTRSSQVPAYRAYRQGLRLAL